MKQKIQNPKTLIILVGISILAVAFFFIISNGKKSPQKVAKVQSSKEAIETTAPATPEATEAVDPNEAKIYSFFQGPRAWEKQIPWSGSWANLTLEGNKFGSFGCGLCCLANVYSTLSDYTCSPVDIYHYAVEVSTYNPSTGMGAIDWPAMKETLAVCGISSEIKKKPENYADFQNDIAISTGTIALVSSNNSNEYWTHTPGHYITLWNYNAEDDTVFLTDSGNITHNRQRIKLDIVFRSLKESNNFQYMTTSGYNDEINHWKWDKISEEWIEP